jgi:geranylgeranyl diphosphate synthase type II
MYTQPELKKIIDTSLVNLSYNQESERLTDPVKYVLSIGGKRLRPVLALMVCSMYGDKIDEAIIPVTGLEVFHNFTLVHDDIMDRAPVRRGFSTVHTKWNVNQAILSGDIMAFMTNECLLQSPLHILQKVFRIFNKTAIEVCVGQQLDMDFEKATIVSRAEYIRMIELKTAVLIAASARIGALFGGADDREADLMYEFGRNLGIAFQIRDDILDTYGDKKVFGKTTGGDILARKKTFLYVRAMEIASTEQKKKLQELYTAETDPVLKVREVTEFYDQLRIRSFSESLMEDYHRNAMGYLENAGAPADRKAELVQMAGSLFGRDN